ncbi:hypothetical protein QYM36_001626 [Artemia franciscana]|uniref:Uncharacterized protein n=1 Tax=Artemia franciscana TaxID=6661 RepID=A0AA88IEK0_ARTSF|nr:hypothetical protein QYM36_001626 [Artemia franciscana]
MASTLQLFETISKPYNTRASNKLLNLEFEYDFNIDAACEVEVRRHGCEFSDLEDSDDEWKMPEEVPEHLLYLTSLKDRRSSQIILKKEEKLM